MATELEAVLADVAQVAKYQGRFKDGADTLLQCLDAHEALYVRAMRVYTYAHLEFTEDGTDPMKQGNAARVGSMMATIRAALSFVNSEILELPDAIVERYILENLDLKVLKRTCWIY